MLFIYYSPRCFHDLLYRMRNVHALRNLSQFLHVPHVHVLIKVYYSRCSHNGQGMLSPRLTPLTPKQGISVSRRRYFRRSACCCSVRNPFCNAGAGPARRLEARTRFPQREACPGAPNPVSPWLCCSCSCIFLALQVSPSSSGTCVSQSRRRDDAPDFRSSCDRMVVMRVFKSSDK